MRRRVLVAGVGNELLHDDGFGVVLARRLADAAVPADVRIVETGIAGIGLVQELMDGYAGLIILDSVERGATPGTLFVLEADVPPVAGLTDAERATLVTDIHLAVPSSALILARALGVLPEHAYIVGCQPGNLEVGLGLSAEVEAALPVAVERVQHLASSFPLGAPLPLSGAGASERVGV